MLFGSFDDILDFMSSLPFILGMAVLLVALIGLFIFLRKRGSSED
jgi:hypothetical protein